ncbi:hypothetical protein DOTSEDRAFT_67825 [Dothistroma septosporum NZE10]|uniref:N-acetyltransferase domain-containing protein n=1 Tax=Dothistroma septosporum (strain NZE10 / CBS 128990) TaxID=675120 RepID=N1Q328_DOTSN|nr:hypothetical protein DOTSEDRAFT_67825 [Dothistroma septosporum NZE10]
MSPLILDYSPESSPSPTRKARPTSFSVSLAKYDDIRRLVDIEFFAFEHEKTNHVLSYRDHNQPAHFQRAVRLYQSAMSKAAALRRQWKAGRSVQQRRAIPDLDAARFRKVVDADSGLIVSWAKTENHAYTAEELGSPADVGHEGESQMNRDWFALNERLRRQYMDTKRHCYIGMVATQPAYQHNGAGTMLLLDILAEADAVGIECYLEATDTAKPLYERHGFVTVNELRFDPAAYGVYGYDIERQTIMVRGALDTRGQRQRVRSWEEAVPGPQAQL